MDSIHAWGLRGGSYRGKPLACKATLAVLRVIDEEGLGARAVALGRRVREELL